MASSALSGPTERLKASNPALGGLPLFLLDEFAALGRLEAVERAMGLMAGYGLQRWPILQDMSQLKDLYGERAGTFIANAGVQQVFGVNDFETAKWLSQMMGQETTGYQTESYRPGDPPSIGNNLTGRDLLTRMRSCSFALKTSSCGFRARPRQSPRSCATAPTANLTGCSSRRTIDPERMPPMTDASPALPDDELRETLELLSTVMASVSDRVDAQTGVLDRVNKTATEARQAAFAARSQTDPKKYGELVGESIDGRINDNLVRMARMITDLRHATNATGETLQKAEEDKFAMFRQVRDREEKADRLKHRLPWFGLGAVLVALVLTIALPRFYASNAATCAVLGAEWTRTTSGVDACVF